MSLCIKLHIVKFVHTGRRGRASSEKRLMPSWRRRPTSCGTSRRTTEGEEFTYLLVWQECVYETLQRNPDLQLQRICARRKRTGQTTAAPAANAVAATHAAPTEYPLAYPSPVEHSTAVCHTTLHKERAAATWIPYLVLHDE